MEPTEEQKKLLRKCARFYAQGDFDLVDDVSEEDIMKLNKLLKQDKELENLFVEYLEQCKKNDK